MTLTQAATLTKRGVITFIILIILSILGAVGYNIWHQYYLSTLPPVEELPEMKFGDLPKVNFPPSNVSSSNFSYSLDTTTGKLPQIPKMIKVYFIPKAGITLLAPEKAGKIAESLGFALGPNIISTSEYQFNDESGGQMSIDLTTGNFHFQRKTNPAVEEATESAKPKVLPSQEKIVENFKDYLSSRNLLAEELRNGKNKVIFDKNNNQDSNSAIVSLWPADLDKLPILTPNVTQSLVRGTVNKSDEKNFSNINWIYWLIDKTTSSTYPLKSPEQALADLQAGQGFVSLEPTRPQVSIANVYLAYFESEEYQPYLQPIFVFEGPDFTAFVPAVAESSK
ncbi:MAG: hypothetical protein V1808_02465 [Candidatus Daviesbacteria bacterium]